jgi:hypothetical protein
MRGDRAAGIGRGDSSAKQVFEKGAFHGGSQACDGGHNAVNCRF